MTTEEAMALFDSRFWESMSHSERAVFQMNQELLCMPFWVVHEAVEKHLGRPVATHEFAFASLRDEVNGNRPAPTMDEILNLIPADKRVLVVVAKGKR